MFLAAARRHASQIASSDLVKRGSTVGGPDCEACGIARTLLQPGILSNAVFALLGHTGSFPFGTRILRQQCETESVVAFVSVLALGGVLFFRACKAWGVSRGVLYREIESVDSGGKFLLTHLTCRTALRHIPFDGLPQLGAGICFPAGFGCGSKWTYFVSARTRA
jgi:hypothetical protein